MIDYLLIAILILSGIALIIIEIIFVPGTTIVGIFGVGIGVYGIYRTYEQFGQMVGGAVAFAAIVTTVAAIVYSFKAGHWERFALKSSIDNKVNEGLHDQLKIGQQGKSISVLKPIGKAEFENEEYEVSTLGDYVEQDILIEIIRIENHKILVKPINS